MKLFKTLAAGLVGVALLAGTAHAAGSYKHPHGPEEGWAWEGVFGKYDKPAMQRGFQVYKEVCSACHGLKLLSYRNLGEKGGPFYDPEFPNPNDNPMVKAIAAQYQVSELDMDSGDMVSRAATPADRFVYPFENEAIARLANGGAYPPDLSVMTKARHYKADYLYSLLAGYPEDPPEGLNVPVGQYFNPYFPGDTKPFWEGAEGEYPKGGFLAMAPQLFEDRVEYQDGTPATVEQMAYDVTMFLAWAAEPKLEQRKELGLSVMIFLFILAGLLYMSYRQIWRDVH